jgi:hypothetical protein
MTREKIREQIAKNKYYAYCKAKNWLLDKWEDEPEVVKDQYRIQADSILSIKGLAILSDDQSLPTPLNILYPDILITARESGQQDMLKAGFRRIEL